MRLLQQAAMKLDACVARAGIATAWIGIPALVACAAAEPISRWLGVGEGVPWGEGATVAFLAVVMTGFGYAYVEGAHVRLDHLSRHWSARARAALELAATLFILMPLCAMVFVDGADSAWRSLQQGEHWAGTDWSLQWVVRACVPLGFLLLLLAAAAGALRSLRTLLAR